MPPSTRVLSEGLQVAGLPSASIQLVPTTDRAAVGYMLAEMARYIDVIVPRGGKQLIERVQREARVPVIGHLEGLCHVFVERAADLAMAREIVLNSKLRRTGVCGAAETLLVDRGCAPTHLGPLVKALLEAGCEVRGDETTRALRSRGCNPRPSRIGPPSISMPSLPCAWSMGWMRRSSTSAATGRITRIAS